ncbi:MAG: hypothetical protein GF418_14135 [Chitinivibrionales bacterium]|nr:hypothetical protein [Chitinivibrionales bacterium]MBD3396758.1 hypothetical protein [Chitinivibrionales bacterium]
MPASQDSVLVPLLHNRKLISLDGRFPCVLYACMNAPSNCKFSTMKRTSRGRRTTLMNCMTAVYRASVFVAVLFAGACAAAEGAVESALSELAGRLLSQAGLSGKHTLAVMPFESRGSHGPEVGRGIAEYLVAMMQGNPSVDLVDRIEFSKVMEELALSQSGAIDESKALEAGKALAAEFLLLGSISDALGKGMVNARLIQAETGRIVSASSIPIDPGALTGFARELFAEKGQVTASLFRSMVIPGWGQFYTSHPVRGGISIAAFAAAGVVTGVFIGKAAGRGSDYEDFNESMKRQDDEAVFRESVCPTGCTQTEFNALKSAYSDSLFEAYEREKRKAVIFGGVTAGVWALNLVDAAIAGAQSRKAFKLYFGAHALTHYEAGVVYAF